MSDDHLENALVELDALLTSPIEREEALAALTTTLATLVGHVDAAQISRLDDSERQRLRDKLKRIYKAVDELASRYDAASYSIMIGFPLQVEVTFDWSPD